MNKITFIHLYFKYKQKKGRKKKGSSKGRKHFNSLKNNSEDRKDAKIKVIRERNKVKEDEDDDEYKHPNPHMIHLSKLNKIFALHSSEIRANKKDKKKLL